MIGIMENSRVPKRLLVIDIDGLRQDVFHQALERGLAPHLNGLLRPVDGQPACHLNPVSPVPSITFCAQSTIFTGRQPETHGIAGNQFFDRFGKTNGGQPRFYAFDVGDALAYNDAVLTFTSIPSLSSGLAGQVLASNVPTLYEIAGQNGKSSTVVYHMISRGAQAW
jgi:predicted AlkP superfamily pyrophosphatase or phosphodiesterase